MRRKSFFRKVLQCLCIPAVQAELVGNVVSFTAGWVASIVAFSATGGTIIVSVADSVPCWAILVLREWRTARGFI